MSNYDKLLTLSLSMDNSLSDSRNAEISVTTASQCAVSACSPLLALLIHAQFILHSHKEF